MSSWEVSALKINNTVEHVANSISESFKNYYSNLEEPCKHARQSTQ